MPEFQVSGMTCGRCEAAVSRAVRSVDQAAQVRVDRASGRVAVDSHADAAALKQAIEGEGYGVEAWGGETPNQMQGERR